MPETTPKKPEKIFLVFEYKCKKYRIEEKSDPIFWDENLGDWNWYWWEEGNGGCDCNRSIYINKAFPEFEIKNCGHEIDLVDYDFT